MKLYFSGGNLSVPQGGQVHVQYSYGAFLKAGADVREGLRDSISEGTQALRETIGHMQAVGPRGINDTFRTWVVRYFLVDPDALSFSAEFNTILAVLKLTLAGVTSAGTSIKIYSKWGAARGYVTTHMKGNKAHRTPGMWHNADGTTQRGQKGDIHLSIDGVTSKSLIATKLFIHEATHKYANTADFGEKGYTDDNTGAFRATGLTKAQALMNADSYGRLATHFYRETHGLSLW